MAERISIAAEPRTIIGKKVKQLRRSGIVPAVVYGRTDPMNVQMNANELFLAIRDAGRTSLIDLKMGGDKKTVLARDIHQHPTRSDILHVDFLEVDMNVSIIVDIELVRVGVARPVSEGLGTVTVVPNTIQIEATPDNLISEVEVDLTLIDKPGDLIHASDLILPEGVSLASPPDTLIAKFDRPRGAEDVEGEEGEEGIQALELDED